MRTVFVLLPLQFLCDNAQLQQSQTAQVSHTRVPVFLTMADTVSTSPKVNSPAHMTDTQLQ